MNDKKELLAEEVLIIRHSGEIPEVTLHGSIYFLTEDQEGPRLTLTEDDLALLKDQVINRYREIIMRDLDPENRDKPIYRGLKRSIANWNRLTGFCRREGKSFENIRRETAEALMKFLFRETEEVRAGLRTTCLNCGTGELVAFAEELGIKRKNLPEGWQRLMGP